jgi:NitT/TauT family transport system substrate-binding protein
MKAMPAHGLGSMCGRATLLAALVGALTLESAAAEPVRIRFGWTNTPTALAPLLFHRTHNLRHHGKTYVVDLVRFTGSTPLLGALKSDQIDIGAVSFANLGNAIVQQGAQDLRIVADGAQGGVNGYSSVAYYVRNDSAIRSIADLKGKVVASNARGGTSDFGLAAALHRQGFKEKLDYTLVHAPYPQLGNMLLDGRLDLIALPAPFTYEPKFKANARILFTVEDVLGPTQQLIIASKSGFLDKNRAPVQDFFEDYLVSLRWYLDPANRPAAIAGLASVTKLPEQRFVSWAFTKDSFYHDPQGRPNLDALKANLATMKEMGLLPVALDPTPYVDLSFLDEAARRLK